ncbi:MAG: SDR family oxidoreductase [Solirubrobacterales bacterium]
MPLDSRTVDLRLDGKTALVTGGSRGIGRAIAEAFAAAGARVMITARNEANLKEAAASIGGDVGWHVANVGSEVAAEKAMKATVERFGSIDVLVNNAATNPYMGPLMDIESDQMTKTAEVNLQSVVTWSQLAWQLSLHDRGGVIINIASIGGMTVEPEIGYYNATKAALIHLTRQLAVELSPTVRVVGIAPGLVKTDMAAALWEGREAAMSGRLPRGRLGESADIGFGALFLASDAADWITGTTLTIDGGQHLVAAFGRPDEALSDTDNEKSDRHLVGIEKE